MNYIKVCGLAGVLGILAGTASATLISDPGINPNVKMGGLLFDGYGGSTTLNDGSATPITYYDSGKGPEGAFGYNLGAQASVTNITLRQDAEGFRGRIQTAKVYTSAGVYDWSLANQDVVTLNLNVATSWVMIQPTSSYAGDANIRLNELEVYASSFTPLVNLAPVSAMTLITGWNNGSATVLTNQYLGGQWSETYAGFQQAIHNGTTGSPIISFDFGSQFTVDKFGLGQFAQNNGRQMVQGYTLEFSNLGDFSVLVGTVSGTMTNDLYYQQASFAPVTAQYVRFTRTSAYAAGDPNLAYTEFQFFQALDEVSAVPEPSTILLFGVGGFMVYRRMRRQ